MVLNLIIVMNKASGCIQGKLLFQEQLDRYQRCYQSESRLETEQCNRKFSRFALQVPLN